LQILKRLFNSFSQPVNNLSKPSLANNQYAKQSTGIKISNWKYNLRLEKRQTGNVEISGWKYIP